MLKFGRNKKNIIIVDDNQSVAKGLKKYFERNGLLAEALYSAQDLRNRLSDTAPDILVLDVKLSDGDGIKLIPEIKNVWPKVPIVILTAMGYDDVLMKQAKEQQAQGYVSKSVPPDQLLANILGILEHPEHHQ